MKIDSMSFGLEDTGRMEEKMYRNEPFVRWGLLNDHCDKLYHYVDYSPINSACIRAKVDRARGKGLVKDYKINNKETLNDVLSQCFFEYVTTGNLFISVVWKKDRREGISGINIIPSKFMRAGQPKNAELYSDTWYYCHDWVMWKKSGIIEMKEFDPNCYEDKQIIQVKNYQPGYLFYGAPSWSSSILDVRLSRAISEYNLANITNGASPSLWINFPENPPDSQNEQENVLQRLEERYSGAKNTGRMIVSWSGAESAGPAITQISQNMQSGMFSEIFSLVRENILAGHQIPDPSLLGLPSPTGFSSQADQLETANKLFMSTTILPLQDFILNELKPIIQLMYPNEQIDLRIDQNILLQ